ncbi:MAG: polysaccharide deacetylase family protein [Anaerocolumna sp.]
MGKKTENYIISYLLIIALLMVSLSLFNTTYQLVSKPISTEEGVIYLPIVMYHQVKPSNFGKDVISPSEFESDLKYLYENDYNTITMNELIDFVYHNKPLPENPIMLTFDDGYLSTYKYAFPLLKKYNYKIVLSIIGKSTDDFTRVHDENVNYSHLSWDKINEMLDSGLVEIQNHTYNLHTTKKGRIGVKPKPGESFSEYNLILADDLTKLQDEIKTLTGESPTTFTYPYGEFSEETITVLEELGFQAGLTCDYGVNVIRRDDTNLYELKRMCRSHGVSIHKLLQDGWKTIR